MTHNYFPFPRKREAQVFPTVSWQQYQEIDKAFECIPGGKFRYLDGILEIMSISPEHEDFKTTRRMLLEAYLRAKRIRFYGRGGPSLGSQELGVRSEPDVELLGFCDTTHLHASASGSSILMYTSPSNSTATRNFS